MKAPIILEHIWKYVTIKSEWIALLIKPQLFSPVWMNS